MKRFLTLALSAAAVLLLPNCTPSTPQTRIDRNYSLYESLPPRHQELVSQGRIEKGMSKQGVYLAFGQPSRKSEGFRDGASFERWDYTGLRPYYYNSVHGYFGRGWGHHRYDHYYHGFAFAPTVEYVPYRSSTVLFRRGVVDAWERFSPPAY